jgi:uracil-DNA glycosylase
METGGFVRAVGAREVKMQADWLALLRDEFDSDYMRELSRFLRERRAEGAVIYPPATDIFRAFWSTPPQRVRVVVVGQDPYHNPGQAHGLCFSVNPGVPVPPSLGNIYRELHRDLGLPVPTHGCLQAWADRGVLLMNSVLTVERNRPGAHQGKGWERFTDRVIAVLSAAERPLVFLLWGSYAQKKGARIDRERHCVLTAPHPSPLSAHRGFLGCGHFSTANAFLESRGLESMDWSLPAAAVRSTATAGE